MAIVEKTKFEIQERGKVSFLNGFNQVPRGKVREVKQAIMKILNVKTRATFDYRLKGQVTYNQAEIDAITRIFNEHGITENIWSHVD